MSQFLDHLADDVMPALIERLSVENLSTLPAKPPEENAAEQDCGYRRKNKVVS